jgi:hypothetical protein
MARHDHLWSGSTRRWQLILGWGLAIAALVVVVVVVLSRNSTTVVRTVIERVPATLASVTQDTPAGALADAEAFWAASDAIPGKLQTWTLAYKVDSYTPLAATLESWGFATGGGEAGWRTVRVTVHYARGRWQPVGVLDFASFADPAGDPASPQFDTTIASFHRFPGQP